MRRSHNCRAPGCTEGVHLNSLAGVCWHHMHDPDHCGCRTCSAARTLRDRPDIRVVDVPYLSTTSGVPASAPVSLPREPWS